MTTGQQTTGTNGLRAAIYRRVSDPKQEREGASLDTQAIDCRAHCRQQRYTVAYDIHDVHTGDELDERPGMSELRRLMRRGLVDLVVVRTWDRLSRNVTSREVLRYEAGQRSIRIESVMEESDESPFGIFKEQVATFVAMVERGKIRDRAERGNRHRAEQGIPIAPGRAPYGYRWADSHTKTAYVEDTATAPVVRRIFAEIAGGSALNEMLRRLRREGIPSPTGKQWQHGPLRYLLNNPIYWGEPVALRRRASRVRRMQLDGTSRTVTRQTKTPERHIPLSTQNIPPLVEKAVALAAHATIAANRNQSGRPSAHSEDYLLHGGFARCGVCGRALYCYYRAAKRPHHYYRCHAISARLTVEEHPAVHRASLPIDAWVWSEAEKFLADPSIFREKLATLEAHYGEALTSQVAALEAHIAEVERQRGNAEWGIVQLGPASPASGGLLEQLERLGYELDRYRQERASLASEVAHWDEMREQLARVEAYARDAKTGKTGKTGEGLAAMTREEKRLALLVLGCTVTVHATGHQPPYEVSFNPLESRTFRGYKGHQSTASAAANPNLDRW